MVDVVPQDEAVAVARVLLPAVRLAAGSGSKQLEKRFNYLWQAAHACVASCSPAAHQMTWALSPPFPRHPSCLEVHASSVNRSASMVHSARLNRVALPADVLDFVCERCAGLLLPTVSADVRVVPLAANAAANRRLAKQRRRAKRSSAVSSAPEVITTALVRLLCVHVFCVC
jgi:RNase P subunit RPR2